MTPNPRLAEIAREEREAITCLPDLDHRTAEQLAIKVAQKWAEYREQRVCGDCGRPPSTTTSQCYGCGSMLIYRFEYEAREKG